MPGPLTPVTPALEGKIQQSLDKIAKTGFLQVDASLTGAQVALGQRLTPTWSLGGWAGLTWDGRKEAGVRLKGEW